MDVYDETTVKGRLLRFLKSKRVTQSEFTRMMGVSPTYVGAMRKSMPETRVMQMTKLFPDLNRDWLLYGEGEMLIDKDDSRIAQKEIRQYEVPLLPVNAFAGCLQNWSQSVLERQCERIMSPLKDVDFAIRISGDSMEPTFHDGSTLLIKRINEKAFIPWGHAMVIDTENGVLVKVVFPENTGKTEKPEFIEARSYNDKYPPIMIPTSSIYGLYRVMGNIQLYSTM